MTDVFAAAIPSKEIRLGTTVQDTLTGLTGTVVSKHEAFGGAVEWGIQPPMPGPKSDMPEMEFVPEVILLYTGEGVSERLPAIPNTDTLVLGDAVEDRVTAIKGIAIERVTTLNGTIQYLVEPKAAKGVFLVGSLIDHLRLIKTGPGLNKAPKAKAAPKVKKKTKVVKKTVKAPAKKPKA